MKYRTSFDLEIVITLIFLLLLDINAKNLGKPFREKMDLSTLTIQ